ncbi:MAG: response regulator [Fusicatenibacter sp.]
MSYKLLLVDDEPFMLSYLKSCIPWETMDVEVIDCACNGEDAIQKTSLHHPDLVITDIVMPNMYGLDFIKAIYRQYKSTKIIILSGHQNFNFAKEALLYGVIDYIVKPSLASDITAAVAKAIAAIEQERMDQQNFQNILSSLQHSIPDITRSFLNLFLSDPVPDFSAQLKEKCSILNFPLENRTFCCFKILFDSTLTDGREEAASQEMELLCQRILNLPSADRVIYSRIQFNTYAGIISLWDQHTDPIRKVISDTIQQYLPSRMSLTFCMSLPLEHLECAASAFTQIQHTLNSRTCSFSSHCYQCQDPMNTCDDAPPVFSEEAYKKALRELSLSGCSQMIHQWLEYAVASRLSMYRLRRELRAILIALDTLLASLKTGISPLLLELGLTEVSLQQEESLLRLEKMLNLLNQKVILRLSDCESAKYPPVIFNACQYIEEHYREKITVTNLADHLYLSPNYLSSLFKKHTGVSISEYITMCRIRKAKELMADSSNRKTYEVADLVGYSDYEHFRQVFKKYVGINPAKYKTEVILPK